MKPQLHLRRFGRLATMLLVSAMACPARPQTYIEMDGLWVDLLEEAPPSREPFGGALRSLTTPIEAMQRGAMAVTLLREPQPAASALQRAEEHFQRAQDYIREREWKKALLELRDALAFAPNHPLLLSRAGMIALELREYERAEHYLARYLEQHPTDVQHLAARVTALFALARLDQTEALVERGLALAPEALSLRFHRAALRLVREKTLDDAAFWRQRSFEELLMATDWFTVWEEDLVRILGPADKKTLAIHILGEVLAERLAEARNTMQQVLALWNASRFREARERVETMIRWGARQYGMRAMLADLLLAENWTAEGLGIWRELTEEYPQMVLVWRHYGHRLLQAGQPDALGVLKECLAKEGASDFDRFLYACALAEAGKTSEAQGFFDELVGKNPAAVRAWIENDPVLERALRRVRNALNYLRAMGIPPESE